MAGALKTQMCGVTDPGVVRDSNEDTIRWDAAAGWAVLADGMGGHLAGEVASALAGDLLQDYLHREGPSPDSDGLRRAVEEANSRIHREAEGDIRRHNMGTTVVAASFGEGELVCAYVGDSRLYRFRGDELSQLSHDHSLVQELVDEGMMSSEEAAESTHKNVITRALGLEAEVKVDLLQERVEAGDLYLFCSDGLSDKIPDAELPGYLEGDDLEGMTQALVEEAKKRGGEDNISVILVRVC